MKLGIAGFGFVGQAVYSAIKRPYETENKTDVIMYDPPKGMDCLDELLQTDAIFCCLPTPSSPDGQDFSIFSEFLEKMENLDYQGIIIIKSTVLYSKLEPFLKTPIINIVVNPEFLNQNSSVEDFYNQKYIILGGRADLTARIADIYREGFNFTEFPNFIFCSEKEAIEVKYTHNVYHALKVLYWNYVHEMTGNERKIFDMYLKVTGKLEKFEMARVFADGRPGFGGACFPKDVFARHKEKPHELTEFMIKYNKSLRGIEYKDN